MPCEVQGFHPTRHVLIPAPGTYDPQTCDSLITVYPGEAYSARLGDINQGGLAEQLKYTLTIDEDSYLFIYRYAVVFEDANHAVVEQPAFKIEIQNEAGQVVDSTCGYYYIAAQPSMPGWHTCSSLPGEDRRWKEWTTVGMDMTPYYGEVITVVFTTRGCWYSAHQGYAYINTYCSKLNLDIALCEGDTNAVLTAPPGFIYEWSTLNGDTSINGDTTSSITINQPVTGDEYFCNLTSYNGCEVTISQLLTYTVIHTGFTTLENCSGLPVHFIDTTWVNQNEVVDWHWDFDDGTPVVEGVQHPVHIFSSPGTYDVTLISFSTEGCSDTATVAVLIDSLPNVSNDTMRIAICSRSGTDIQLVSEVSSTQFTWLAESLSTNITGFNNNPVPSLYLNDTLINTGAEIDSVLYTITPHNNDCDGFDTLFTVLVYPLPILTNPTLVKSICDSASTNIGLESNNDSTRFTWTCTASSGIVTGFTENLSTPDTLINQILRNSGTTTDTVYYHLVPQSYGCFGDTITFKVAVYPVPDLTNLPPLQTQCNETPTAINLTSSVAGATFTWEAFSTTPAITGYSPNLGPGATSINQTLTNAGSETDTVTYRIMPRANNCQGDSTDYLVVVFPTPDLSNTPTILSQCNYQTTSILLTSTVDSARFTWRAFTTSANLSGYLTNPGPADTLITQTLTNSGYTIDTVVYRLLPSANGCSGDSADMKVAVYPTPDLSNAATLQTQCNNQQTNITLLSHVANTAFTWKAYTTSANITGFSDNTGPGTTTINHPLVNAGTEPDTVTYRLLPLANGCPGDSTDYHVVVYPTPDLSSFPLMEAQCNHTETSIFLTSNVANTTFTWRAFSDSPDISGYSSNIGQGANEIAQTLINAGTTIDTVYYRLLPESNGCTGDSIDYKVAVYPTPDLSNSPAWQTQCNSQLTGITLASSVANTTFTWRAFATSASISGYNGNAGPGSTLINQTLVNTGYETDTVIYRLMPSSNNCTADSTDYQVIVYPTPDLSNDPPLQTQCNNQLTGITLASHVENTTFTWRAFATSPDISGFSSHAGPGVITIDQPLFNAGYNIDTVTYRLVPMANNCTGDSVDYRVVVFPTPDLSNTPALQTQCNNQPVNLTLTSHVANTGFTWRAFTGSANLSGFSDHTGTGVTFIDHTLLNSGNTIDTVTYLLVPEANNCSGDSTDYRVVVFPTPGLANLPAVQSQCNGLNTAISLTSGVNNTTFTWTVTQPSGNVTGWFGNNGPGVTQIDQTLILSGWVGDSVIYHLTPSANGCDGVVTPYTVYVNPIPELTNAPLFDSICSEEITNIDLTSTVLSTSFSWTAAQGTGNISGYGDGTGNLIAQQLLNPDPVTGSILYTITPATVNCTGLDTTFTQWIKPLPHLINQPKADSLCNSTSPLLTLTSDVANAWFTWTATGSSPQINGYSDQPAPVTLLDQNLFNTGFVNEWASYQITPLAAGCQGPDSTFTVTVFPVPDLANDPPDTAICSGQPTGIVLTSHVATTQFTFTAAGSSGQVTGYSNSTSPGTLIDQPLTNSGYAIETVTYTLTPEANGCQGNPWIYTVTVFPVPDLSNAPLSKEICNNNNTNLDLTSHVNNTLFTWTATPSSANITGYSDNPVPAAHIGDNLINLGDINETVTYHITPHANGCSGMVFDFVLTVVPSPFLTNTPLNQSICNGFATSLTLQSNVAGTQFSWTAEGSSFQVTGFMNSSVPGTLIDQTLINSGFTTETVTYHITPENSGCPGSVTNYTFSVYPVPDVFFVPTGETICEGLSTAISLQSHVTGTSYSWTATASSLYLSGYANDSGDQIAQMIHNAGATIETVTYQVTPEANGCPPGTTLPVVVTVNPRPAVSANPPGQAICSASSTGLTLTGDVTGTAFTWRAFTSSANLTGYSDGSGPVIIQNLTNSGYTIDTVTYRIAGTANGCTGDSTDIRVVVFPVADVLFTPTAQSLCSGETTSLAIASHVANSSYTWTATPSGPTVSGYAPGSGNFIAQTLINSSYTIPTVTYTVVPVANGCTGTANTVVTEVYPWPVASLTACYDTLTSTAGNPFTLKGAIPSGGILSGSGVTGTTFYPAIAGIGDHEIRYIYINDYGCSDTATITIHVVDQPLHTCGDLLTDIRDNRQYPTVQIGAQCWMAANLDFGSALVSSQVQRDNCIPEKYCINDNPVNCSAFGGLYQWAEIMRYTTDNFAQGFCPPGWHIPAETDWNILFNNFISNGFAGNALKTTGYSGFNSLLEGIRFHNSVWRFRSNDAILRSTLFWSSTLHGPEKAWAHGINEVVANDEYTPSVSYYPSLWTNAFAIRCIKN